MTEESVIVVDVGSASVKAGFAAEDAPCSVFPSIAAKSARGVLVRLIKHFFFDNCVNKLKKNAAATDLHFNLSLFTLVLVATSHTSHLLTKDLTAITQDRYIPFTVDK